MTLTLYSLIGIGVIGAIVLELYAPQTFGAYTQFVFTIVAFGLTATVTIAGLTHVTTKLDTVVKQTNGINDAVMQAATSATQAQAQLAQQVKSNTDQINTPLDGQKGNG